MAVARLVIVWAVLATLLAITVAASFLPLGAALPLVSLAIAAIKSAIVLWFFIGVGRLSASGRLLLGLAATMLIVLMAMLTADFGFRARGGPIAGASKTTSNGLPAADRFGSTRR